MLQAVLNNLPSSWEPRSYSTTPYHLVEVERNTREYSDIENLFDAYTVSKIERVQNPFQFGRFLIHREHEQLSEHPEIMSFLAISQENLDIALKYNCDYRRLRHPDEWFFTNASSAHSYKGTGTMIVLKTIQGSLNHDSKRYPQYVVTYKES